MQKIPKEIRDLHIVALAGGVGGAKLAYGLAQILPHENFNIIVNTGDDFYHFGLKICPDIDTICYTLAGLSNKRTGWGLEGDTSNVLSALQLLEAPTWFALGDKDLATHLERTRRLTEGQTLTQVTSHFLNQWGIKNVIYPMTNDSVSTMVKTKDDQWLAFQEYFVHQACMPEISEINFLGILDAEPSPGVLECIQKSDLVIICPSNPWVSIDPILFIRGIRQTLISKKVIAVSPIVGGKALKGPAAKMFTELGFQASVLSVMEHYQDLLSGLIIDNSDKAFFEIISQCNIIPFITNTIMINDQDKIDLATSVLNFGLRILNSEVVL